MKCQIIVFSRKVAIAKCIFIADYRNNNTTFMLYVEYGYEII